MSLDYLRQELPPRGSINIRPTGHLLKDKTGITSNYYYDPLGQLTKVTRNNERIIQYTYDAVGNRTSMTNTVGTTYYGYDAQNKLQYYNEPNPDKPSVRVNVNYSYDANGNQIAEATEKGTTYFYYDPENRLIRIKYANSQIPDSTSTYNGDGRRVRFNDNLSNTYYIYDGANIVADTDGTGVIKSYYLRGPAGNLVSIENSNKVYYYATDGLGSVTGITDETGAIVNNYQYDEFGLISSQKADVKNPFKFTGAIHDQNANLYLMGARYYNPKVGRFITQDSYGAAFGADWTDHLYSYTANNPVNMIDPTGHFAQGTILQYGSRGSDVTALQQRLEDMGLLDMHNSKGELIDHGYFGKKTLAAVNLYKAIFGLANSGKNAGKVGATTWKRLGLSIQGTGKNNYIPPTLTPEQAFQKMKQINGTCHYPGERLGAPQVELSGSFISVGAGAAFGKGAQYQKIRLSINGEERIYNSVDIITGTGVTIPQFSQGQIYNLESFEQFESAFSIGAGGGISFKKFTYIGGGISVSYMGQNSKNQPIVAIATSVGVGIGDFNGTTVGVNTWR